MDVACEIYREVMNRIEHLPPMPETISKVMEMSRSDDYSSNQLADLVCRDPTLAARVLKLCNSGFTGVAQEMTSIHKAVMLLGFEMVKNLVFSSFVHSVMDTDVEGYAQTAQSLWEHSLGVASASLVIAGHKAPSLTDTAYTGGLIHDIGKVILASFMAGRFNEVLELMRARRISSHEAELIVLGTTHQEIGGVVSERWHIAPQLRDAITHHHSPEEAEVSRELSSIIGLADAICGMYGIGSGIEATDGTLPTGAMEFLGIEDRELELIAGQILERTMSVRDSHVLTSF